MRDELIKLIKASSPNTIEGLGEDLLAAGVIVLPCKVGQTIFFCTRICNEEGEEKFDILEGEVRSFSLQKEGLWMCCHYECGLIHWHLAKAFERLKALVERGDVEQDLGKIVFLTKEEAERALAERNDSV